MPRGGVEKTERPQTSKYARGGPGPGRRALLHKQCVGTVGRGARNGRRAAIGRRGNGRRGAQRTSSDGENPPPAQPPTYSPEPRETDTKMHSVFIGKS